MCKEMRKIYVDQVQMKVWPALATKIPEANLVESKKLEEDAGRRKNHNGYNVQSCRQDRVLQSYSYILKDCYNRRS